MKNYKFKLNSKTQVEVVSELTKNGVITTELTVTVSPDHISGITTALLRSIPSPVLRPNPNRNYSYEDAVNIPPPSPNWHSVKNHRNITPDELKAIADVYKNALSSGLHPTKLIKIWLKTSLPTASRYVRYAREAGLIGAPAKKGLPGDF